MFGALGIAVLALVLTEGSASAGQCYDLITGGGYIFISGAKGTFGVGGGCQNGSYWGHLEYQDDGIGLNVHSTSITAYNEWNSGVDYQGRPIGRRRICGTARTDLYGDVDFAVVVRDGNVSDPSTPGEPGVNDEFDIQLRKSGSAGAPPVEPVYSTFYSSVGYPHILGGGNGGGGNIQLHKPNDSTYGPIDGPCPGGAN
ncbi:MAG TPA: post-COAP-1 domain-containing protein [Vicinamibacterales bacterium]|jgi:hypothetical protein